MNRTPAQTFALVFGALYLLVGLVGFAVTGFSDFAADTEDTLIIFEINPLHNIVHLAIGAAFLLGAKSHNTAKIANTVIGAAYLLVALVGLTGILRFLNIETGPVPDFWLHIVSALAALYFGTAGAGDRTTA